MVFIVRMGLKMTNKQIEKDFEQFKATGCDYSNDMRQRDQDEIRKAELWSLVFFGLGALMSGIAIGSLL